MSSSFRTAAPHPIFSNLDSLARTSRLIQRHSRKFSASGFLLSLIQCATRGTSSFHHLATAQAGFEPLPMTRQAMAQRLSPASSQFLVRVMQQLLCDPSNSTSGSFFRRILIEDSTVISMAKSNAEHFPNNGNGKVDTAGCKINLVTEAISGLPVSAGLYDARDPDQSIGFELPERCRAGDLVIRDRGYFSLDAIAQIESHHAFWISRLPASLTCFDGEGVYLDEILRKTTAKRLDMTVWIGRHRAHRCRLVATRLSARQTEKNRRQRRRNSKRHQAKVSKRGLLQDGWSLIITNASAEQVDPIQIAKLYSTRWGIEIQFRALKQSNQLHHSLNHRTDPFLIEALILAVLIRHLLTLELQARIRQDSPPGDLISIEKLSDAFSHYLLTRSSENRTAPFRFDLRHLVHEKRSRSTLYASTIQPLT